jgi:hypothetical protein
MEAILSRRSGMGWGKVTRKGDAMPGGAAKGVVVEKARWVRWWLSGKERRTAPTKMGAQTVSEWEMEAASSA